MTSNQLMVKMVFDRWNSLLNICTALLDTISDEQLHQEIASGKNRGIYLLGHLIAVHDDMLQILNVHQQEYPELFELFIKSPDKSVATIPTAQELRTIWKSQLASLASKLGSLSAEEWFEKQPSVSAADFEKEPHRNKLNVLLIRTSHLSYHVGQLALLKS